MMTKEPKRHYFGIPLTQDTAFIALVRANAIMEAAQPDDIIVWPENAEVAVQASIENNLKGKFYDLFQKIKHEKGPHTDPDADISVDIAAAIQKVSEMMIAGMMPVNSPVYETQPRWVSDLVGARIRIQTPIVVSQDIDDLDVLDRENGTQIAEAGEVFDVTTVNSNGYVKFRGVDSDVSFSAFVTDGLGNSNTLSLNEIYSVKSTVIQKREVTSGGDDSALRAKCFELKKRFPVLTPITHFPKSDNKDSMENPKSVPITPEKRKNDYHHFAGGLRAHRLEDLIYKAAAGEPSADLRIMVQGVINSARSLCHESLKGVGPVEDKYGVLEYADAIADYYDCLLANRVRAADSTYVMSRGAPRTLDRRR